MIIPPFLKPGDTIGIVASARKVSSADISEGMEMISRWGFKPKQGNYLFRSFHQFAGTDEERAADLQAMMDDPEVKAVIFARGGYGTVRIIDQLDFSKLKQNPKWFCGFSDITVLHSHLHSLGMASMHTPMLTAMKKAYPEPSWQSNMLKMLTGQKVKYEITHTNKEIIKPGSAKGILCGGNLSLIYSLIGSGSDIDTTGKILFIEDLDEYLYHIDRMIQNLRRTGKLEKLKGLIVGGMSDMKDNTVPFGQQAEEIIADSLKNYTYPITMGFPAGHLDNNQPLMFGAEVSLSVDTEKTILEFI